MKNAIKIMALGGLGEVGKNCYVIEYNNDLYVVDYGVLFATESQLGVDYVIPNFTYLKENEDRIKALYITHGHEDHIGAIPFLLKNVKIKTIYAPRIASEMIQRKLKEHKIGQNITEFNDETILKYDDMVISFFRQTHSIPDSYGMYFETPNGNIVHTGDFKVDFSPPGQLPPDFHKMARIGEKGNVLCMLSDSTNAEVKGFSLSESEVGFNLKNIIANTKGRVIMSTFASNMNRVQQMIEGCIENDRSIVILGRSLDNGVKIGSKIGYINTKNKIINHKEIRKYQDNKVAIICTGSQGEPLAALSRIANGLHPSITLSSDDTIIFASNPIPGNNYGVGLLIDALARSGAKIIRNGAVNQVHASGHASKEEQKLLLSLFKPKYFVPIHGTFSMLLAHSKSAQLLNIPERNNFLLDNGDALFLSNTIEPTIKRREADGRSMFVSGNNISVSVNSNNHDKISSNGILLLSLAFDQKTKKIVGRPQITTRGYIHINESLELIRSIRIEFLKTYEQYTKNQP